MRGRERVRDLGLLFLGAVMLTLAAPPVDAWPLGLVAWVPLALGAEERAPWRAFLFGWCQGTAAQGITFLSVIAAVGTAAGAGPIVAALSVVLLAAYEGARFGLVALGTAWMRRRGWPLVVAFPLLLAASERVYPMFFPWSSALLFHRVPVLLQTADLGGTMFVTLWVGLVNVSLAVAWRRRHGPRRTALVYALAVPLATVGAVAGFGALRMQAVAAQTESAPPLVVAVVQGDLEDGRDKASDPLAYYVEASRQLLEHQKADLLVWPETAVPRIVRDDLLESFVASQLFSGGRFGAAARGPLATPLLTGLIVDRFVRAPGPPGTTAARARRLYNAAILASPPGRLLGTYEKRDLVMLGEYLPFEGSLPWLRRLFPSAGTFSAGSSQGETLPLGETRILPLVCFEDILAERVRADVDETDPDLLVDLTSDGWFGTSRIADLHFALAGLRAIEHRRFLVHATNTGVTGVFDPVGRVVARLPSHEQASLVTAVRRMRSRTFYGAYGRSLTVLLSALVLAMAVLRRGCRSGLRSGPG